MNTRDMRLDLTVQNLKEKVNELYFTLGARETSARN